MQRYFHKYLFVLLFSLSFVACESKDKTYNIDGQIDGYSDGIAYLKQFNGEEYICVDSARIEQGYFTFSGKVDQVQLCRIMIEGHKYPIRYFFLEAGQQTYKAQLKGSRMSVPRIGGTFIQNEYTRFQTEKNAIYKKQLVLQRKGLQNSDEKEKVHLQILELNRKMDNLKISIHENYKTPVLSLYLIKESCGSISDYKVLEKQLKAFEAIYSKHALYLAISKRMEALKSISTGRPAPVFEMESLEGTTIRLSDFRGKITMLDFWASWCAPCRKENPNMVKLYQQFHDQGLEIIGISLDRKKERWSNAVKKDNLTWNHVCDYKKWDCPLVEKYAVKGVPFTVLIDREGNIIACGLHGDKLKNKIKQTLEIQ
jgi:peroxiredoxin